MKFSASPFYLRNKEFNLGHRHNWYILYYVSCHINMKWERSNVISYRANFSFWGALFPKWPKTTFSASFDDFCFVVVDLSMSKGRKCKTKRLLHKITPVDITSWRLSDHLKYFTHEAFLFAIIYMPYFSFQLTPEKVGK